VIGPPRPENSPSSNPNSSSSSAFRPPSLNNRGDVAFIADLDDGGRAIFVAPGNRVIGVGDSLDGATISSLSFCEEGLNDSSHLAFLAFLDDPQAPDGFRVAVFRASPQTITSR